MNAWNSTTTDVALLRLYRETRNEEAFAELVRRRLGLVYSAALRQIPEDAQVAEEISQSVFVELVRKADTLVRHPALAGWLYTTACRMAADQRRRRIRNQLRECTMATLPEPAGEPSADWNDLRPILDEVMLELPVTDRHAVLLRYFEQRNFLAIGKELDLSEDAARMRVARALDHLRERLASRGVKSTATALAGTLLAQTMTPIPMRLAPTVLSASMKAVPPATGISAVSGWLVAHWKLAAVATTLVALLTLATHSIENSGLPLAASRPVAEATRPVRPSNGPRPAVVPAGPARPLSPEIERSLAKLRSALFDTRLSALERGTLLKESSGELVGSEAATLPLFREALMSDDPGVVAMAVEASGRFGALPQELHAELMHVFRSTESEDLAGLTGNRLLAGPDLAGEVPNLLQLLQDRPVVRKTLAWLIPDAVDRTPSERERNRQLLEALRDNGTAEVRETAEAILRELPEPAGPESKQTEQVMIELQSGQTTACLNGLMRARGLETCTPELEAQVRQLAASHNEAHVRLAARQAMRRWQFPDDTGSEPVGDLAQRLASGTTAIPEMLSGLTEGPETVRAAAAALSSVDAGYWKDHRAERESAIQVLNTLLQDPDPARVEAASSALSKVRPEAPKPFYTLNELEPLFGVMEEMLTPGEFAIAMRDFKSSVEMIWKSSGSSDVPPTLVPNWLVQGLPVGPMHENFPAYKAMVKAMKGIDPRLQPPTPEN